MNLSKIDLQDLTKVQLKLSPDIWIQQLIKASRSRGITLILSSQLTLPREPKNVRVSYASL